MKSMFVEAVSWMALLELACAAAPVAADAGPPRPLTSSQVQLQLNTNHLI